MSNIDYEDIIKLHLTEKRYNHSLAVADQAVLLADRFGADREKAYTAGILHDIMKDKSKITMLHLMTQFDIMLDDIERATPKLWHAVLGAEYVKRKCGTNDPDIIGAIRYHTTARAGMSILEKVLYLADFTSSDRDFEGVEKIRMATDNLQHAMSESLKFSIIDLVENGNAVHPNTVDAYNELVLGNK